MKKVLFFFIAAIALTVVACNPDNKDNGSGIDWNKVTVNGFYVAGPATGFNEINGDCVMAAGYNEVDKALRDGMYEKYIVLEADKDFYLLYNDGGNKSRYSAELKEFVTPLEEVYTENPEKVLKGALVVGESAPAMKVAKTGLYHIVLDINKTGDLDAAGGAQILLLDASDFGVRGAMNGWGFTSSDPAVTEFSNSGITFTFKNCEMPEGGKYKFATGNYWKVSLDDAGKVKAEVSLASDMTLNGADIAPAEGAGIYDITLTFALKAGSFDRSFSYTETKTGDVAPAEALYIIGSQFGNWAWDSDDVVEMTPVYYGNVEAYKNKLFWATRYITAGAEFKFSPSKAWGADFGSFNEDGTIKGDNNKVEEAGFYTIYVNLVDKKVQIEPAHVYGLGGCFDNKWDFDVAPEFVAEGDKLVLTTTGEAEIRLATKVVPTAAIEGITTPNGWFDWWKTEFVFFDDMKIAYRGAGGDQARTTVAAGKKVILDFNAGTVAVEDAGPAFVPAITVDGDMSDWADIEGAETPDAICKVMKVTNDEKFFYVYLASAPGSRGSQLWGEEAGYYYVDFDWDNNAETGIAENSNPGFDCWFFMYVFGGTADAPIIKEHPNGSGREMSIENITAKGVITTDLIEIELSIPRADMVAVEAGAQARILSWRSKDGTKITQIYTVK
ncbi:MAG: SusF/SusE family outer membrane protein [Bacteroidales bacterium]|nr:SusF/SusE family outer membrane protein [Bacteroidales bacterium]